MIFPRADDRSIVVFKLWPALAYGRRLAISLGAIAVGLAVQAATESFLWGGLLVAAGNLLLLVSGYDNRVDFAAYDPEAEWVRADLKRLEELHALDRQIRRWDLSALDVTNPLGAVVFGLVAGGILVLAVVFPGPVRILVLDAAVLLLPHWVTGTRSVLRLPKLLVKVDSLRKVLDESRESLAPHGVHLMMLLRGADTRVPDDVKVRIDPAGKPPDLLGLYGQVVLNEVQGRSYPYFYVVLVARRGFGLGETYRSLSIPGGITAEFNLQDEVEVLVLRQTTTKTSGYYTEPWAALGILHEGLRLAERVAKQGAAQ